MTTRIRGLALFAAVGFALLIAPSLSSAQIQYARGQDVTPAYEGWQKNSDGSFTMYFGYMNRNYEEEVDIPVGPNNTVDPGGDRGQPAHFYPRRQRFVFKVVVPKDWGAERKLLWTLTVRGKTNVAKGWLQPEWEVNKEVIMENLSGGANDPDNQPPTITGSSAQSVTLPNAVTLTATAVDDGRPLRRRASSTERKATSEADKRLTIRWIEYRGPGPVVFDPPVEAAASGRPEATKASFRIPGQYLLRAVVSDGVLEAYHDVAVTVSPAAVK